MKPIKTTGYAAVNILTKPPHIMCWTVAGMAKTVRNTVADNWPDRPGEVGGWKAAMRDGVRVRKVKIETIS